MKLTAVVHLAAPQHGAGAEWYLHSLFRDYVARGDECTILHPKAAESTFEGVRIGPWPARFQDACAAVADADLLVTHLDMTRQATAVARETGKPLVHLVHNDRQLAHHGVTPSSAQLVVFNSRWIAEARPWPGRWVVARPHVRVADYEVVDGPHDRVTLVNLSQAKGSRVLGHLARALPDVQFLAVQGAYGRQEAGILRRLPNVELVRQTANIRDDVYARTRVLLMPSAYESWGRVAIEAACSGIPTIAAPTPGLTEALGDAGTFVALDDLDGWVRAVKSWVGGQPGGILWPVEPVRQRAVELESVTQGDLDRLHDALGSLLLGSSMPSPTPPKPLLSPSAASVAVLIPYRPDESGWRQRALDWVVARYHRMHPGWQVIVATDRDPGPWSKGRQVAEARRVVDRAEVLVIADADCYVDADNLKTAVDQCAHGAPWAVPFTHVKRWSPRSTEHIYQGDQAPSSVELSPRRAQRGGGITVIRAETYDACPMDPRFVGWGGEDSAFGRALEVLYGEPPRPPTAYCHHLWHPSVAPRRRQSPPSPENRELLARYGSADWQTMSEIVAEARIACGLVAG